MEINYKELFELSPACFLILDPGLNIVAVTEAYLAATMTTRAQITGKHVFDAFPDNPEDPQADGVNNLRASLSKVLRSGKADTMSIQKYDIRKPESQGGEFESRYWSPVNIPVPDENGKVKLIIHRVEDVTEYVLLRQKGQEQEKTNRRLKSLSDKMELEILQRNKEIRQANLELEELNKSLQEKTEELKRSNEELSRFAATASHDIKAPFRSVGGYLEIVKEKIGDLKFDPELNDAFSRISAARGRIASLLDDLLKFAQVTHYKLEMTKVDMNLALEDALHDLDFNIKDSHASIIINEKLPEVKGNHVLLVQLFQNLIGNGIKFQDKKQPKVWVSVQRNKDVYQFAVKDNGIGIKAEYFDKIFQVFERLHGQEEFSGTGLGLAICQRIVERHGGRVWLESTPGDGSIFYFTLPAFERSAD